MVAKTKPKYKLSIDLNALNHLGINLYSNIPAVVSEVVANSWDADAEHVSIQIDPGAGTVVIVDDGAGMSEDEINHRYLKVGYRKRETEGAHTPKHRRHVMGRKGIGKLSLFSIADIIEVHSVKTDSKGRVLERNGFVMRASRIREAIERGDGIAHYEPEVIEPVPADLTSGTRIILRDLKKSAHVTAKSLRKRLARRFSVIGPEHQFEVEVDGAPITVEDRDYFAKIEYVWYFGQDSEQYAEACTNAKKKLQLDGTVDAANKYAISGWIGTFDERKSIEEGNNSIVVLAWGKLVQEDLLKDLEEGGLFTKYLTGEIRADFVDLDQQQDIATSDRQRLREDDPRYVALKRFVQRIVKTDVQGSWRDWRTEHGTQRAMEIPAVKAWFESLGSDNRKYAKQLFGKIESLALPDPSAKKELYRQSIMAFETLALKNNLGALAAIEDPNEVERLTSIFAGMQELEAAHYYQIVKGRLEVLTKLDRVKDKALEKVVQQHVFDNLWLLDPSWERASTDQGMEVIIGKAFKKVDAKLTQEQKRARLDIKYRTAAGKNIVIELKRYDRVVDIHELLEQIGKYYGVLKKVLAAKYPQQPQSTEFICILGSEPRSDAPEKVAGLLRQYDARYITYDDLLKQTRDSYRDYLEREGKIARILQLVESI
ncbi:MAG: ATP-binding protein [Gemmatimonadaceae bacterium]